MCSQAPVWQQVPRQPSEQALVLQPAQALEQVLPKLARIVSSSQLELSNG